MSRRTLAACVAVACLAALWTAALVMPVPYVTYKPGLSVDVLAEEHGKEIVQISGHPVYRDNGELRMTTIYLTRPDRKVNIFEALSAWFSRDDAIYPRSAVYDESQTAEQSETESAVQMVSSQDSATAAALHALGYKFPTVVEALDVTAGLPAQGKLQVRDIFLRVDGKPVKSAQDIVDAVTSAKPGVPVTFVVRRAGKPLTVSITPVPVTDKGGTHLRIGVIPGPGYVFPFSVSVNIPEQIGGPSAGLMFSLAIYDTLTPGSLTGGKIVAGTGTIDPDGKVGPIGGIQQKIVTAQNAHAELFMVPADNCEDALGAPDRGMRLVKATTMESAMKSIQEWVKDPNATLPSCEDKA
jgi:Lon-like protease